MSHIFSATRKLPSGIRITTVITVPMEQAWKDVGEMHDLAAMGTAKTADGVERSWTRAAEECPF